MSKAIESNINEEINAAGDGSGVALPPAFVIVQPRVHRRMKKNNGDKVDGRTSGAKALFTRIQIGQNDPTVHGVKVGTKQIVKSSDFITQITQPVSRIGNLFLLYRAIDVD